MLSRWKIRNSISKAKENSFVTVWVQCTVKNVNAVSFSSRAYDSGQYVTPVLNLKVQIR